MSPVPSVNYFKTRLLAHKLTRCRHCTQDQLSALSVIRALGVLCTITFLLAMAQKESQKKFNAPSSIMELGKKLDPKGDIRPMADDDAAFAYDKLYELAAREMDPQEAKTLTEGLIETVFRITLRYRDKNFTDKELINGFFLKTKARDLFLRITNYYEGTVSYDEDKDNLLSTVESVVQLLYSLVDENFREARKLDAVHTFLTKDDILGKLFKPDGPHHDILKSCVEVFSKMLDGEIFTLRIF